jgi:S1-C subfamily serine protease
MPPFFVSKVLQMNHNRLVVAYAVARRLPSAAVIFLAGALAYGTLQPSGAETPAAPLRLPPPAAKALPAPMTPSTMGEVQLSFAPVVKRVAPAVVNVYARSVAQVQVNPLFSDPFFSQFFGATRRAWAPA